MIANNFQQYKKLPPVSFVPITSKLFCHVIFKLTSWCTNWLFDFGWFCLNSSSSNFVNSSKVGSVPLTTQRLLDQIPLEVTFLFLEINSYSLWGSLWCQFHLVCEKLECRSVDVIPNVFTQKDMLVRRILPTIYSVLRKTSGKLCFHFRNI